MEQLHTRCIIVFSLSVLSQKSNGQSTYSLSLLVDSNKQKILVEENVRTGKKDSIQQGAYIKLWIRSDEVRHKAQPLARVDFNKKTFYYEAPIVFITDSTLILARRHPFPLSARQTGFDTVYIRNITSFRVYHKNGENTAKNSLTMPFISLLPTEFTSFPGMLYMMPATGIAMAYTATVLYPMRHTISKKNPYRLTVREQTLDSVYFIKNPPLLPDTTQVWEIDRLSRRERAYARAKFILDERLLTDNTDNRVVSITMGGMYFPAYAHGAEDTKTRVNISDNAFVFGLASERFITNKDRIGVELQLNIPSKAVDVYGTSFSGGAGSIFSISSYMKIGLGGLYGKRLRNTLMGNMSHIDPHTNDPELHAKYFSERAKLIAEPKAYFLFGAGATNTTLIRVKGNMTGSLSTTDYTQKKLSIQSGLGLSSRLGKRVLYDMALKYVWSPNYNPSIGGLENYSGLKLQFNIGYMFGPGFSRNKRILREINKNIR
ncbi:hypothetical protein SAMN05428988_5847 [Chitinophaga sp. YR573]|uniref:hypothetical protein n=1 Tax=Chitinophaga sp. YR573 TaxID=1881040 RepID=UPI0008B75E00|nr:hypothetical protein [Chitinophaga sp. YR573]SEW44746.1 hypothetical protein SAMN05428988_5847 [Chitinophaga sp. YR573]